MQPSSLALKMAKFADF